MYDARKDSANVAVVDVQENGAKALEFAKDFGWAFPVGLDGDGRVAQAFKVAGIPTIFVLDAEGRVAGTIVGAADEQALLSALDRAAAGK